MQSHYSQSPFDLTIFEELKELLEEDAYELLDLFNEIGPSLAAQISSAAITRGFEELTMAAHTLKSNSAQLGALRLSEMCRELEELSRSGTNIDLSQRANSIHAELQSVLAELQQIQR